MQKGTTAKKSLGQHFLTSQSAITKIRDAADIVANDIVLEIGPGRGILTEMLVIFSGKVVAIEKDRDLIPFLEEKFAKEIAAGKLELLQEDILDFDPEVMKFYQKDHDYKLVANIPYYITGAIIEKFLSTSCQPEQMVLLVQKEVAERIIARDKKESILSIAVKAYGTPKIIAKVPAGAFNPPPKVDSAILSIERISRDLFKDCDEFLFFKIVKGVFGKKRKQIGATLGEILKNKDLAKKSLTAVGIDTKARPEDLTLDNWKKLVQVLG
jgi:16S rRNA (adenine1518-N6/adenine1519-N6)-dimethyltransferase